MRCEKPFKYSPEFPEIVCNQKIKGYNKGKTFNYNPETKRFIFAQVGTSGYIYDHKSPDTDVLYAGTCQKF